MPGLAKVGKTARASSERVSELSSATGVPSPFILAFQQPVSNCDAAEVWVHRELDRAGYRLAAKREFFNAPLHEIVEIVTQASKIQAISEEVFPQGGSDGSEGALLELADELCELGHAHLDGTDNLLPNRRKALTYFEQAAVLGHPGACMMAGLLYRWGDDGKGKNLEKALVFLNKAVQLGNWQCLASVASIFLEAGNSSAAERHWNRFFSASQDAITGSTDDVDYAERALHGDGVTYCELIAADELKHCVDSNTFNNMANLLLSGVEKQISKVSTHSDKWWVEHKQSRLLKARHFIQNRIAASS